MNLRDPQWWKRHIQDSLDFDEGSMLIMSLVDFWIEISSPKNLRPKLSWMYMPHVINTSLIHFLGPKIIPLRISVLECWAYTLQQSHKTCISGTKASLWPLSLPNSTQWSMLTADYILFKHTSQVQIGWRVQSLSIVIGRHHWWVCDKVLLFT